MLAAEADSKTTVYLVTHALTQWNVDGKRQGHTDTPLNAVGEKMAALLALRLEGEGLTAIWSSDLKRSYDTAAAVARRVGLEVRTDSRLRETRWVNPDRDSEYPVLPFPVESETHGDVQVRMVEALKDIVAQCRGGRVLVVSHGGAVKAFFKWVAAHGDRRAEDYRGYKSSVNIFTCDSGLWSCILINSVEHLEPLRRNDTLDKNAG